MKDADLLIVIGTSLQVQPFASLTRYVPDSCPRVLINLENAGDIGERPDDVVCIGKCDDVVRELAEELGWGKELKKAWDKTKFSVEGAEPEEESEQDGEDSEEAEPETEEQMLMREIAQLTKSVDQTLKVTDALKRNVKNDVEAEATVSPSEPTSDKKEVKL